MNHLLDDDEDIAAQPDRELTLSTGSIIGIFFGLVLLCGAFFGFGYKMGSHKATPAADITTVENTPSTTASFNSFKPAAGSPSNSASSAANRPAPIITQPATSSAPVADASPAPPEAAPIVHNSNAAVTHTPVSPAIVPPTVPVAMGTIFVQVAAVSHQEDAQLLLGALRAKGYPVVARTEPQDKLFHVQVGPFGNKKDAESARQRLVADGYQPILK